MKKYFIAVAAMAFLAACSGKQAQKDVPVEVEEEEFAIMSAAPDAPSLPPGFFSRLLKQAASAIPKEPSGSTSGLSW